MSTIGFWAIAQEEPDSIAVVDPDERVITRGELLASSNRIAHRLQELGLQRGDGVAWVIHNSREFLEMFLAATQIGLYATPLNFHLTGPEIAYIVEDCEAKAFVCHERFAEASEYAVAESGLSKEVCFAAGGPVKGCRPYEDLQDGQSSELPENRSAGQMMLYTSGTTGRPKGVRRSLPDGDPEQGAALMAMLGALLKIEPGTGAHLLTGPFYHTAPLGFGIGSVHLGQNIVMMDKWDAEQMLVLMDRYKITTSHMVPTMFHRVLALPEEKRAAYDLSSLEVVLHGAAPCPVEVKRGVIEWWGPVLYEYYGATEGGGTLVTSEEWLEHPGTVGQPWPGSEVLILDDEGKTLPEKQAGAIYMSSLAGDFSYYKDKEKTEGSRRGNLFTVGDVGYLEDGWLYLCDRKADMIISGGVNIYPAEVEAILLMHPAVGDAAVFGIPNDEWGESVKAVVEPASGVVADEKLAKELLAHCQKSLAKFKCPRSLDFLEELPRQPSGKLYKRLLRDEYWKGRDRAI